MNRLRACIKMKSGPAAANFGRGQGGELRASPSRQVGISNEPTLATDKRRAARRVFAQKAAWLRCSSLTDPPGICSLVAPRHSAFWAKTGPLFILKQALSVMAVLGVFAVFDTHAQPFPFFGGFNNATQNRTTTSANYNPAGNVGNANIMVDPDTHNLIIDAD